MVGFSFAKDVMDDGNDCWWDGIGGGGASGVSGGGASGGGGGAAMVDIFCLFLLSLCVYVCVYRV